MGHLSSISDFSPVTGRYILLHTTEYNLSHCDLPLNLTTPRLVCMLFKKDESTDFWLDVVECQIAIQVLTYLLLMSLFISLQITDK